MKISRGFLLLLIFVFLILSIAMVLPFFQYFLLAVLLAYVLMPLQKRLQNRIRPMLAAGSIVFASLVLVIIPLTYVSRIAIIELRGLIRGIREDEITFETFEGRVQAITGMDIDITAKISSIVEGTQAGDLVFFVDTLGHLLIGLGLTVFLLYYFLKDGDTFLDWIRRILPLPAHVIDRIFAESDQLMKAVLIGHVLVALVQGVLAGIGLVIVGLPNPVLWTAVMILLSLIPIVGSFLVWGPAGIFLFVQGDVLLGGFLLFWGIIVVGFSDDYLRPIIVDRYAKVNPSVIGLGVFGGIFVFGVMGIFYGPLVLGLLRVTLEVFSEEMGEDGDPDLSS